MNAFTLFKVFFPEYHWEFYLLSFCNLLILRDVTVKLVVQSEISFRKHIRLIELLRVESRAHI